MTSPSLPPTFPVRLLSTRPLTASVRELVFEREGAPLLFEPGQWVSLRIPVGPGPEDVVKRSYSIASAPDGTGRFELAVTLVQGGPGSTALHALAPGAVLQATGPQGFFSRPPGLPSLFVATGTGVTPLRSMIRAVLTPDPSPDIPERGAGERRAEERGAREPMVLLLGVRHEADLLYRDELEQLARSHPDLRLHFCLSRPHAGWTGRVGYVQEHIPELWRQLLAHDPQPHAFLCGLDRMVSAAREVLRKTLGAARQQVHSERFD